MKKSEEKTGSDLTVAAYNRNADRYDERFGEYAPYREKIILFQESYLSENDSILDIGCGPGSNAGLLLELDKSYRITGIDLSEEMIGIARKKVSGCNFRMQDIRSLEADAKYHAVIASFCIVHLTAEETAEMLKTVSAMLEKNGVLYLSFMEGTTSGLETTSFSEDEIFFNYYTVPEIRDMLAYVSIECTEILSEPYCEPDGSLTRDIFIFARKSAA